MTVKLLEIRDSATFLPVFAMLMEGVNDSQVYLLRRSGYGRATNLVMLGRLRGGPCSYDPYSWCDRTMATAHNYIQENFDTLKDGDVIDVEFILGETQTKKISESAECPL